MAKNRGLNKLLRDKRLELGYTLEDAAKILKYNKTHLRLIEEGYLPVRKKKQPSFIKEYHLDDSFFDNDLEYPIILQESEVKYRKERFYKIINSRWFKIGCYVFCAGFLALTSAGAAMFMDTRTKTTSFYDQNINEMRDYTINCHDKKYGAHLSEITAIGDAVYEINNDYDKTRTHDLRIQFPEKEANIVFFNLKDSFEIYTTMPSYPAPDEPVKLDVNITARFNSGNIKYEIDYYDKLRHVGAITAVVKKTYTKYRSVEILDEKKKLVKLYDETHPFYIHMLSLFDSTVAEFETQLTPFFANEHVNGGKISYLQFKESAKASSANFFSGVVTALSMLIFGLAFSFLFLALSFLYIFKRMPKTAEDTGKTINEENVVEAVTVKPSNEVKPLKKNWRIVPIFPGNLLKFISISMIFVYSIGFFLLFLNIVKLDFGNVVSIANFRSVFSPFLIIAILLLFFVKLDYIQERKDYFLTNYFYFFCGLALYTLMLVVNSTIAVDDTFMATIGNFVLSVVPGNFLWGILAFNMMVYLLFYNPETIKDEKKKRNFRLLAIIPTAYLLVSLLLEVGKGCWNWNIPFAIENLFFTKSVHLIIFAIAFTYFAYFYKKWTVKKYGAENAKLYQKGNRYYFTKNAVAALIVLIIGIIELIFHFVNPDNPMGFGVDYLILCTIPFILLYHPHHGKRNSLVDNIFLVFYSVAYAIGIGLVVLGILIYLCTIIF